MKSYSFTINLTEEQRDVVARYAAREDGLSIPEAVVAIWWCGAHVLNLAPLPVGDTSTGGEEALAHAIRISNADELGGSS